MTNSDLKEFIEKYKKSIDNREYEEVFNQALLRFGVNTGKFVDLFYKCGIDPLKYMSKVPDYYAINSNLRSITIPGNITSVGRKAFFDCHLLMSVTISGGVTSIDDGAFANCTSLTSITISDSITGIGSGAFFGCTSLNAVYITDIAAWCNIKFNNHAANPLLYAQNLYLNGELVTDLVIPGNVTSIGAGTFRECTSLLSVTMGDDVTNIGYDAFESCTSLTSVTINNGIKRIDNGAFEYCTKLETINYAGSKEQWNSINKKSYWNLNAGIKSIVCKDGIINI